MVEMNPILFLSMENKDNYSYISYLGFPINYHIRIEDRDIITRDLLISSNRIVLEAEFLDDEKEIWLTRFLRRTYHYGVEVYLVTREKPTDRLGQAKIIPLSAEWGADLELIAIKTDNVPNKSDRKLYIITRREPWHEGIIGDIHREFIWGITGPIDEIFRRDEVLYFDKQSGIFRFISLDEYIREHIGETSEYLQNTYGTKSLMLGQLYRFYYESKSEDKIDKMDARIGLSIINLYIPYEI